VITRDVFTGDNDCDVFTGDNDCDVFTGDNDCDVCKQEQSRKIVIEVIGRTCNLTNFRRKHPRDKIKKMVKFLRTSGWLTKQLVGSSSDYDVSEVQQWIDNQKIRRKQIDELSFDIYLMSNFQRIQSRLFAELAFGLYSVLLGYSGLC
jgi:hypothetical protein